MGGDGLSETVEKIILALCKEKLSSAGIESDESLETLDAIFISSMRVQGTSKYTLRYGHHLYLCSYAQSVHLIVVILYACPR